jgi:hypothetical protein
MTGMVTAIVRVIIVIVVAVATARPTGVAIVIAGAHDARWGVNGDEGHGASKQRGERNHRQQEFSHRFTALSFWVRYNEKRHEGCGSILPYRFSDDSHCQAGGLSC